MQNDPPSHALPPREALAAWLPEEAEALAKAREACEGREPPPPRSSPYWQPGSGRGAAAFDDEIDRMRREAVDARRCDPFAALAAAEEAAKAALAAGLAAGRLIAWGRRGPLEAFQRVPADAWPRLRLNVPEAAAKARGPDGKWQAAVVALRLAPADSLAAPVAANPAPLVRSAADLPADCSLMIAACWTASRDAALTARASPDRREISRFRLTFRDAAAAAEGRDGTMSSEAAEALLLQWLRSGALVANGEWTATGERRDMPSAEWVFLLLDTEAGNDRDILPGRLAGGIDQRWRRVTVRRDALLVLAPPISAEPEPAAEPEQAPPEEAGAPEVAETKAAYSAAALRGWYVLRVRAWPAAAPPPSEKNDIAAAKGYFGDAVTRAAIRALGDIRPEGWRKQGPRKASGAVNPPGQRR